MTQGHIQYERFQRSHWDDENKRHVTDADTYHPPPETHVRQAPEKQARMLLFLHLGLCIVSLCALSTSVLLHRKPTQLESAQRVSTYCESPNLPTSGRKLIRVFVQLRFGMWLNSGLVILSTTLTIRAYTADRQLSSEKRHGISCGIVSYVPD
jgi:hypothetical protein